MDWQARFAVMIFKVQREPRESIISFKYVSEIIKKVRIRFRLHFGLEIGVQIISENQTYLKTSAV